MIKLLVEKGDYFSMSSFCHAAIMDKLKEAIALYSSIASSDVDESVKKKVEFLDGLEIDKIDAIRRLLEAATTLRSQK